MAAALTDADVVGSINAALDANAADLTTLGIAENAAGLTKLLTAAFGLVIREAYGAKAAVAQAAGAAAQSQASTNVGSLQQAATATETRVAGLFQ